MRYPRRLFGSGIVVLVVMFGVLSSAGSSAPPSSCNLSNLQLRASTVNQGLPYDRLVRGKETLVRLFLSLPSCAGATASIQITGGTLSAKNGGTSLASGITGTPTPVNVFPSVATYSTAALNDSPGDIKFVVPGSALAPAGTTAAYTAVFRADLTFQYKTSNSATPIAATKTFDNFASKTVEKKTNALRILVVPMGNAANAYSSEFPASAVAAVENGMQTLSRIFPVPSGVGTLGGSSGGIRYAIDPTLLNVATPYCGDGGNFDAIKAQLAQFLVSWNTENPTAQADRVVGAISSDKSLGGSNGCAEGMASLISPEAWVRAFPDLADSPSVTGALFAMEIAHTFGLVPASRSFSTFHSLNTAADGTDPNRGYNVALRAFLADDRSATKLAGTWNNNTTILEKADYAYLLCVLGGTTNSECTTSAVAGSATGVAALSTAFALTGHTDDTLVGTVAQESYVAADLEGRGTDTGSEYKLVQRGGNNSILQTTGVRVAFAETIHEDPDDPDQTGSPLGTFAVVAGLSASAQKFELWKGTPGSGILLWSALKTNPPVIVPGSFTVSSAGARNYTNTPNQDDDQAALTSDAGRVAWSLDGGIRVGPSTDSTEAVTVPKPAVLGGNGPIVFSSSRDGDYDIWTMSGDGTDPVQLTNTADRDGDPQWSSDNHEIVFVRNGNIWSMQADGTGQVQLTTLGGRDPSVAPDGRIAFISARDNPEAELYVMNHDGSGETRLTNNTALEQDTAWSPRNDVIAFASTRSGNWRLYTTAPDGSGQAEVPNTQDGDLNPAFSPTGDRLAFFRAAIIPDVVDIDLAVMGIDGTGRTQLMNTSPERETDPSWSGDGTAIVFRTRSDEFDTLSQIEVIDVATGGRTLLSVIGATYDDTDPSWQVIRPSASDPAWGGDAGDGAHLAFVSEGSLYVVDVNLSGAIPRFGDLRRLYNGGDARQPTISEEDSAVVFAVGETSGDLVLHDLVTEDANSSFLTDGGGPYRNPSLSRGLDGDVLAVEIPNVDSQPEIWSSPILLSDPSLNFDRLLTDAYQPSWGTDGRLAFGRGGDIWVWTPPVIEGPGTEEKVFDVGSNPALAGDTYAFERSIGTGEFPPSDIFIGSPGSGITVNVQVTDDNAADNRLDLLVDCPGLTYVGAVALLPTDVVGASASWAANFDPSLTCENPTLRVAISDGYNRVLSDGAGEEIEAEQKGPTAAIYTPPVGSTFRQYDVIPARGGGWDAEDGTLPDANLDWQLAQDGVGVVATDSGHSIVDFSPPATGFAPGDYTLTLTVTDSLGNEDSATRTFTIVADADNDGLTAAEEALGCVTYDPFYSGPDQDPLNAFRDDDNDGIPNVDDAAICTAATAYAAIVDIDADMVKSQPTGVITAFVTLRYRPITDVNGATVRISSINGIDANILSLRWSIDKNGVGIAKFDKGALVAFLTAHDIGSGYALITISGDSYAGWTFEGSDLTFVH